MLKKNIMARWIIIFLFAISARAEAYDDAVATERSGVETLVLAKTSSSWDGNVLPGYPEGQSEITILNIKIHPGVKLPMHSHPVINAGYMVKGGLTVMTEKGDTLYLREGDAIVEVVDTWHYGYNEGDDVAEIVVFYAGVEGSPVCEYN